MDGRTDGREDGGTGRRRDGRTDGQEDGWTGGPAGTAPAGPPVLPSLRLRRYPLRACGPQSLRLGIIAANAAVRNRLRPSTMAPDSSPSSGACTSGPASFPSMAALNATPGPDSHTSISVDSGHPLGAKWNTRVGGRQPSRSSTL